MRTALVRSGDLLINLNAILYGKVEQHETKWRATVVFREGRSCYWTVDTRDAAISKLEELITKSNEVALTEVLG